MTDEKNPGSPGIERGQEEMNAIIALAAEVRAMQGSGEEERLIAEEIAALAWLRETLHPIMRLIDAPILSAWGGNSDARGNGWREHEEILGRGIILDAHAWGGEDGQDRGAYEGWRLLLMRDGRLIRQERSGSWSRWQGEGSGWEAEASEIAAGAAIEASGLLRLIKGAEDALRRAIEGAEGKKKQLEGRRALLTAIRQAARLPSTGGA